MMYPAFISTPTSSSREATTVHSQLPETPSPIPIALLSIFGSGHQPYSNSQTYSSSSLSYGSSSHIFGQAYGVESPPKAYGVESPPKLEALRVSPSPNLQPQRVFAPIFTTVAPVREEFLENTATMVPKTSTTTPMPTTTTTTTTTSTTPFPTTISEMTTTASMYYTSVSLSQTQSVSTSVVKPAWARRLVFNNNERD